MVLWSFPGGAERRGWRGRRDVSGCDGYQVPEDRNTSAVVLQLLGTGLWVLAKLFLGWLASGLLCCVWYLGSLAVLGFCGVEGRQFCKAQGALGKP